MFLAYCLYTGSCICRSEPDMIYWLLTVFSQMRSKSYTLVKYLRPDSGQHQARTGLGNPDRAWYFLPSGTFQAQKFCSEPQLRFQAKSFIFSAHAQIKQGAIWVCFKPEILNACQKNPSLKKIPEYIWLRSNLGLFPAQECFILYLSI